ncbi:hypothetical protein Tco_0435615 [Tanacetum coccineum]
MSSASSAVTYTSVYTDSEPGRVFWGADEELSDSGSPRVIVYRYDGLPMQPVALPSPDYIPDPEEPHTPLVPQDKDEREPMFIQPHDPNYVPEPIYPEYIPLEDEHVFLVEEQPLPPIDSPTAESPGYVVESDLEEDPEEYEDDESDPEDGPVDYPMDGGEDGDDNDGDLSGDDVDDEDEDEEEEEEHLALADSVVIVPTVEPVYPLEGIEPVIPPPFTDISTTRARITIQLQASISFPPEAEVKRLLAMPTPSPSSLISLSPPSVEERLARCTALSTHLSPPPMPSPLLPSSRCPTQIQTLIIASTQALVDAVTAALPSPPLPPLPPSLYIPPPVDHKDDIPKSERPPRKRSCLFALGSRYKVRESSTARPTGGQGIDYEFFSTVDAEARRRGIREVRYGIRDTWVDPAKAVPEIAPMTVEEVNTRVTELAELHEHDMQDLYALLKDAQDRLSQAVHYELQTHRKQVYAHESQIQHIRHSYSYKGYTYSRTQHQAELLALREQQRRARQPGPDVRVPDHHDASRGVDSHIYSYRDNRRNVQTARPCFYADFMKCQPLNFKGTEGVVGLTRCCFDLVEWSDKNLRSRCIFNDLGSTQEEDDRQLTLIYTKFVANETEKVDKYISGLPDNIYGDVKSSRPKTLDETIELANDLMDQKLRTYAERQTNNKRRADDSSRNNHGHQQQSFKR